MDHPTQGFETHRRYVPMYHVVTLGILLANIVVTVGRLVVGFSAGAAFQVLVAFAIFMAALYARAFAVANQDRIIRLEERLRFRSLLPGDLQGRIDEFSIDQLASLRFASDAELPSLAREVLERQMNDRDDIKKRIKEWRPDVARV